jgi:hypothetical protein
MILFQFICFIACAGSWDWVGDSSTVVVALVSLCSGVIIAKLNTNLDIEKTLCLRKVEIFEKSILQFNRLINLYGKQMASIDHDWDIKTLNGEIVAMIDNINQASQILQSDDDRLRVMFYTKMPTHDVAPLIHEGARFLQILDDLINSLKSNVAIEEKLDKFNSVRKNYCSLITEEYKYILNARQIVQDAILKDKYMRKLLN